MPYAPVREQWMDEAFCATTDPDLFFPDVGEPAFAAKRVCRECPVIAECLAFAVRERITVGVWGGLAPRERRGL